MQATVRNESMPKNWEGSCSSTEPCLHQLSPYIGRMKSSMAHTLVENYSKPGDLILDPFVGAGTIALEAIALQRNVICSDNSPYAQLLTSAKLNAPKTLNLALKHAENALRAAMKLKANTRNNPNWVKSFFHPRTLREIIALTQVLIQDDDEFTLACLLGILHHQRPGFLSYPASHLVPYLRTKKFPRNEYPDLYAYREIRPRLIAKIERSYRRFPDFSNKGKARIHRGDASELKIGSGTIDAVITSPPYMNALDYARDNRLRLWFLGLKQADLLDQKIRRKEQFFELMIIFLQNAKRWLKPKGKCVLVIGDVNKSNSRINLGQIITEIAVREVGGFKLQDTIMDMVPDVRRARRNGRSTKEEWVIVLNRKD
jgi:DNA modification methylase